MVAGYAMQLRSYQQQLVDGVYAAWADGAMNVLAVAATGSGKTVCFSEIIKRHQGASVVVAHRQELVSQISLALARNEIRHRIVGVTSLPKTCAQIHMAELGKIWIDSNAICGVAGVATLVRMNPQDPWLHRVTLGVQDEAHHLLRSNSWGKATTLFPNARWLGVTATPNRADGYGLGRHADGIMDRMVVAPGMRDLINAGWLSDYRIFAPPSDLDLKNVPISASGDFSPEPLRAAVHKSHIVGDAVQHYLRLTPGKLGITFAVDVESAKAIAAAFRDAGVPAAMISANTPDAERVATLRRFRQRELLQLVNVDIFGEGFDAPAIEVVSFARPTQSFPLYAQQFGRALRVMDGKPYAIIIDHVGNVFRHGLPDRQRAHTLDGRKRQDRPNPIPIRTCTECGASYERTEIQCPYCGTPPDPPAGRSAPEFVDGDLCELDEATLARLRGEIDAYPKFPYNAPPEVVKGIIGRWHQKHGAQMSLRQAISEWAALRTMATEGEEVRKAQKEFFLTFGVDVLSAQALPRAEAEKLEAQIRRQM
jgi:DNA repair protein RadD